MMDAKILRVLLFIGCIFNVGSVTLSQQRNEAPANWTDGHLSGSSAFLIASSGAFHQSSANLTVKPSLKTSLEQFFNGDSNCTSGNCRERRSVSDFRPPFAASDNRLSLLSNMMFSMLKPSSSSIGLKNCTNLNCLELKAKYDMLMSSGGHGKVRSQPRKKSRANPLSLKSSNGRNCTKQNFNKKCKDGENISNLMVSSGRNINNRFKYNEQFSAIQSKNSVSKRRCNCTKQKRNGNRKFGKNVSNLVASSDQNNNNRFQYNEEFSAIKSKKSVSKRRCNCTKQKRNDKHKFGENASNLMASSGQNINNRLHYDEESSAIQSKISVPKSRRSCHGRRHCRGRKSKKNSGISSQLSASSEETMDFSKIAVIVPASSNLVSSKRQRNCMFGRCHGQMVNVKRLSGKKGRRETAKTNLYSPWTDWTPCSRNCRTRRYRTCQVKRLCGNSAIQDDAFCYVKGSMCERMFKRLKKERSSSNSNEMKDQQMPKNLVLNIPKVEECGVSNVTSDLKIIGGHPVIKGKWPWQVVLLNRFKEPFCGGTLIAPQYVLTAAHCLRRPIFVRLGEHDLSVAEGSEQEYRVVEHFIHPDYDPGTVDNDVALLKLGSPVVGSKHVQLACLPRMNAPLPQSRSCVILGWGKARHSADSGTDVLHQARVPIVDNDTCMNGHDDYYLTENMFCAGHSRGRVDSCEGDSGGPLMCEVGNRWHIYGITSFGDGCAQKGKFGIYAKVPNYVDWIHEVMEQNPDIL